MEEKLILLENNVKGEIVYEVHRNEIHREKNIILTTKDKEFAQRLVDGYNNNTVEYLRSKIRDYIEINGYTTKMTLADY